MGRVNRAPGGTRASEGTEPSARVRYCIIVPLEPRDHDDDAVATSAAIAAIAYIVARRPTTATTCAIDAACTAGTAVRGVTTAATTATKTSDA